MDFLLRVEAERLFAVAARFRVDRRIHRRPAAAHDRHGGRRRHQCVHRFAGSRICPRAAADRAGKFFPVLWFGFWLNALSGLILLAIDLTKKLGNPDFYIKMAFIAVAVATVRMLRTAAFGRAAVDEAPLSRRARVLASTSLICWLGAIVAGRLLAYLG